MHRFPLTPDSRLLIRCPCQPAVRPAGESPRPRRHPRHNPLHRPFGGHVHAPALFPFVILVVLTGLLLGCNKQPPGDKAANPTDKAPGDHPQPGRRPAAVHAGRGPDLPGRGHPAASRSSSPTAPAQYEERQRSRPRWTARSTWSRPPIQPGERWTRTTRVVYTCGKTRRRRGRLPPDHRGRTRSRRAASCASSTTSMVTAKMEGAKKIKEPRGEGTQVCGGGRRRRRSSELKIYETGRRRRRHRSDTDVLDDLHHPTSRFEENLAKATQTIAKAEHGLAEAEVLLTKHQVLSRVNGFIRSIAKRPASSSRPARRSSRSSPPTACGSRATWTCSTRPLVEAASMTVTVEPAVPSAPGRRTPAHRQEVTGVAVTAARRTGPLVVSVGADGRRLVWDPNLGEAKDRPTVPHNLPHPVAVPERGLHARRRAKTVLGRHRGRRRQGPHLGRVQPGQAADRAARPSRTTPTRPRCTRSRSARTGSSSPPPPAATCSSGSRDRRKKLYALPAEHRDTVTARHVHPAGHARHGLEGRHAQGVEARRRAGPPWSGRSTTGPARLTCSASATTAAACCSTRTRAASTWWTSPTGRRSGRCRTSARPVVLDGRDVRPHDRPVRPGRADALRHRDGRRRGRPEGRRCRCWHAPAAGGRGAEVARLITPGRVAGDLRPRSARSAASRSWWSAPAPAAVHLWKPPSERPQDARRAGSRTSTRPTPATSPSASRWTTRSSKLLDHSAATIIINRGPVRKLSVSQWSVVESVFCRSGTLTATLATASN